MGVGYKKELREMEASLLEEREEELGRATWKEGGVSGWIELTRKEGKKLGNSTFLF